LTHPPWSVVVLQRGLSVCLSVCFFGLRDYTSHPCLHWLTQVRDFSPSHPLLLFLCWKPLAFFRQKQEKWTWTPNLPVYNPWPAWDFSPAPLSHPFLRIETQSELEHRWQINAECINLISPEEKRWIFLIALKPKSNQTVISYKHTHTSLPHLVLAGLLYRVYLNSHNLWCIQTIL